MVTPVVRQTLINGINIDVKITCIFRDTYFIKYQSSKTLHLKQTCGDLKRLLTKSEVIVLIEEISVFYSTLEAGSLHHLLTIRLHYLRRKS